MAERVLLTGAGGFVGRALGERLIRAGFAVRGVSRRPNALTEIYHDTVPLPDQPAKEEAWAPLLSGVDHVVHCAGIAHATAEIPREAYMAVNAELTGALGETGHRRFDATVRASHEMTWPAVRAKAYTVLVAAQAKDGSWPDAFGSPVVSTASALTTLQLDNGYLPAFTR